MKALKWTLGFTLAVLVGTAFAQIVTRPLDPRTGQSAGVTYFKAASEPACNVGEVGVRLNSSGDHELVVCQENSGWEGFVELDGGDALTGSQTYSGTQTFTGSVVLGADEDDDITVNGPTSFEVYREDFDGGITVSDITNGDFAASVADTEANLLRFQGAQVPLYYRIEQAFGGTYSPALFMDGGVLNLNASILDVTDNDGIEFVLGGPPVTGAGGVGIIFDEDSTETYYCEASVTVATIANITTDDFYFGWFLSAAITDAFAPNSDDTYAMFIVSDNAGDLDIESELNGGGTLNDDTGTTWANAATHVLRVAISADDVDFFVDGTQVTQTNAVLNADNSDLMVCRFGLRSSGTTAGVAINYVEVGRAQ